MALHIDAHEVFERIWVGSKPPVGYHLREAGFTHVALCAVEYQPPAKDYTGVSVVHCPYDDKKDVLLSHATMALVFATARAVCEASRAGGKVLVTCRMGINRSSLVACLAMQMRGVPPWIAVETIRARRHPQCLSNPVFQRIALGDNREASHFLPR